MDIEGLSDFDTYTEQQNFGYADTVLWNGKEVEIIDQLENKAAQFTTAVLASFSMTSLAKPIKIAPKR